MRIRDNGAKYKIYSDGYSISALRDRSKALKKGLKELSDFATSCCSNAAFGFNPASYTELAGKPISKLSKPELVTYAIELQNAVESIIMAIEKNEHTERKINIAPFIQLAEKY